MSNKLNQNFSIDTILGLKVTVIKHLGEGGQGDVYEVDYDGERKALKWYKMGNMHNPEQFKNNIIKNMNDSSPDDKVFLWPIDVTNEDENGTFGYIMDLRPDGYYEVGDFLLCNTRFTSYQNTVDASLKIVNAFRLLHNKGKSYQDLNDGNFFINPTNGKVLICDNDNVAINGEETGILGKPRYMAPEIVMRKKTPDSLSDRFSMSIILFMLFCLNHPLEGKKSLASCLDPKKQEELYGDNAIFIMDKHNKENEPDNKVHRNPLVVWRYLPEYMKSIFEQAFSSDSIKNPNKRPAELDWVRNLVRFRSDIVKCSCGNDIFINDNKQCICDNSSCQKQVIINNFFDIENYPSIPAISKSRIYLCQITTCNPEDALNPIGVVIEKKSQPGILGILNKSDKTWRITTPSGKEKRLAPDEIMPLKTGMKIEVYNTTITIVNN